jgi:hypothetical protein
MNNLSQTSEDIMLKGVNGEVGEINPVGFDIPIQGLKSKPRINTNGMSPMLKNFLMKSVGLPEEVTKKLIAGTLQISDKQYFSIRELATVTSLELLKPDRPLTPGWSNISQQKIDKGRYFLLQSIGLLYSDETALVEDTTLPTENFDAIAPVALMNSLLTLKVDGMEIIGKTLASMFLPDPVIGASSTQDRYGFTKLTNSKMIMPETRIEFTLSDAPSSLTGALKLVLAGLEVKGI